VHCARSIHDEYIGVIHAKGICLFTHPTTVSFPSKNRGRSIVRIQKMRANIQSVKKEGKRAVRGEIEGSYEIDPCK